MKKNTNTLAKRIIGQLRRPSLIYKKISKTIFPIKPINSIKFEAKMYGLQSELKERKISHNFGSLYTLPSSKAIKIYKRFVGYNSNNLGSWSDKNAKLDTTTQIEYEVIHKLIDLYLGDHNAIGGYITSGGTEGNIFSVWLGRTYIEKYHKIDKICLLRTSLTHYSIKKAGKLCSVAEYILPIDEVSWSIYAKSFKSLIENLYSKGYRGFLIPLTLGYTATGACDNVKEIILESRKLKQKFKDIKMFFWIDAALNGLILPFSEIKFKPFEYPEIQSFIVDFHKFGLVPYSSGVILYRNSLKKLIDEPIDYLFETDSTLLGSRPGISAIGIWAMIHSLGKSGYKKIIEEQMINKKYFLEKIKQIFPKIEIINYPNSLSCGIIFNEIKNFVLPKWIEEKYSLYPGKIKASFYPKNQKEKIVYKYFFLPHLKMKVIKEFISDLNCLKRK